jgi:4,5-DOPA dioxygenase extradiol
MPAVAILGARRRNTGRLPAVYLGHGAPTCSTTSLAGRAGGLGAALPRPKAILVVSAHWQSAPLTLGAVDPAPLVYDFYGFPERYYQVRYDSPGAPELAARVKALMPPGEPVADRSANAAWTTAPTCRSSRCTPRPTFRSCRCRCRTWQPEHLFEIGRRLAPLRDEGVLIMGSGFMTHGLPFIDQYWDGREGAPEWSVEFDSGPPRRSSAAISTPSSTSAIEPPACRTPTRRSSISRRSSSPSGAATEPGEAPKFTIEGYWLGLAKRSFEVR